MQILLATVVLAILGAAEGGGYTSLSRRLQEDNVTFVPLPPKIEYPIDPAAMIAGAFVGALGVPFLFGCNTTPQRSNLSDPGYQVAAGFLRATGTSSPTAIGCSSG
ncbi:unnamed protein product [Durusdinium trenchii]|uniref:Uncharacterized protein n=1 Tax=Durusdinium trenchii TaxID=1381693 RepID=A0ABP0L9M1_9DINO